MVSDTSDYDYDLLKLAKQANEDMEYLALIKAIQDKKLPPSKPENDLSPYKLVFNNLRTEETPAGQLILLEGHRVVIPLLARQDILTTLHEYHSTSD